MKTLNLIIKMTEKDKFAIPIPGAYNRLVKVQGGKKASERRSIVFHSICLIPPVSFRFYRVLRR
jgi:hypothetical protein